MHTKEYRYFQLHELDSPDLPGSGINMDPTFMEMLDRARHISGLPFVISEGGGYRTAAYNKELMKRNSKASATSSHLKGLAADIVCKSSRRRCHILLSLLDVGFTRVGLHHGFIHVDLDSEKEEELIWIY